MRFSARTCRQLPVRSSELPSTAPLGLASLCPYSRICRRQPRRVRAHIRPSRLSTRSSEKHHDSSRRPSTRNWQASRLLRWVSFKEKVRTSKLEDRPAEPTVQFLKI